MLVVFLSGGGNFADRRVDSSWVCDPIIPERDASFDFPHAVTGHVLMKDLSDEFIDDPTAEFPMGKLVHARVLSVDQVPVIKSSNRAVVLGGFLPDSFLSAIILYENVSVCLMKLSMKAPVCAGERSK